MKTFSILTVLFTAFISHFSQANALISSAPEHAELYFISPQNGAAINGEVEVVFGLKGMGVAPAGVDKKHTGHHHLIINKEISELDLSMPLPANENVKHFGGGQTQTTLKLPKGTHTLQLLLGNFAHVPHNKPVMSKQITITVK